MVCIPTNHTIIKTLFYAAIFPFVIIVTTGEKNFFEILFDQSGHYIFVYLLTRWISWVLNVETEIFKVSDRALFTWKHHGCNIISKIKRIDVRNVKSLEIRFCIFNLSNMMRSRFPYIIVSNNLLRTIVCLKFFICDCTNLSFCLMSLFI